jgi:hypothetical protein
MRVFPSVRWDEVGDLPHDLFQAMVDLIDERSGG